MRLTRQRPQSPAERPRAAYDLLTPEHNPDDGIEFDPQRDISPRDWEGMKGALDQHRQAKEWYRFSNTEMHLVILFPDRRDELNLNDDVWNRGKGELDWYRQAKNWGLFDGKAMDLAICFHDRRVELRLDDVTWEGMKSELDKHRRAKDWSTFSGMAMGLTILAAEDARITSDGRIEITPKKRKLATESPPLPARPR